MARALISYLDTSVGVWLAENRISNLSRSAITAMEASALLLSPMVVIEFQYLFDIGRTAMPAKDVTRKLEHELGVAVCALPFPAIAEAALDESWTRDPFDRIIVAHAKANGFAPLITSDRKILQHYPRAIW